MPNVPTSGRPKSRKEGSTLSIYSLNHQNLVPIQKFNSARPEYNWHPSEERTYQGGTAEMSKCL